MRPVLLAGPGGSGKDQAACYLAARWDLAIYHLATPLYALYIGATWQAAERHLVANGRNHALVRRQFLQRAGDLYRLFSPTLLVDLLVERAESEGPGIVTNASSPTSMRSADKSPSANSGVPSNAPICWRRANTPGRCT